MNFTTRAWMSPWHQRRLPTNLRRVGRWKDLHKATSLQPMCTCHLAGSPRLLNVLWPPQDHGRCTQSVTSPQSSTYVKRVKYLYIAWLPRSEETQSKKRERDILQWIKRSLKNK